MRRVQKQVQSGAKADFQNVAAGVGEKYTAILGNERPI
jgi:hypothetical protein